MNNIVDYLPKMKTGKELIQALEVLPSYDKKICNEDTVARLIALSDLYKIYIPWITKNGVKVELKFCRFVSYVKKHIIAQKVTIKCDKSARVEVRTGIDGKITNTGVQHFALWI